MRGERLLRGIWIADRPSVGPSQAAKEPLWRGEIRNGDASAIKHMLHLVGCALVVFFFAAPQGAAERTEKSHKAAQQGRRNKKNSPHPPHYLG